MRPYSRVQSPSPRFDGSENPFDHWSSAAVTRTSLLGVHPKCDGLSIPFELVARKAPKRTGPFDAAGGQGAALAVLGGVFDDMDLAAIGTATLQLSLSIQFMPHGAVVAILRAIIDKRFTIQSPPAGGQLIPALRVYGLLGIEALLVVGLLAAWLLG